MQTLGVRSVVGSVVATLGLIAAAAGCGGPGSREASTSSTGTTATSPHLASGGANVENTLSTNLGIAAGNLHLGTVRDAHDDPNLVTHEQEIHAAGLQPLIIMFGCSVDDPGTRLGDNEALSRLMHVIFGNAGVWWELGNENDLQCRLTAAQYTAMWNGQVPALKLLYPQDHFGGPVNFQSNPSYTAYFVQNASPRPDFISWHEYTCSSASGKGYCLQHIANWTTHISRTRRDIAAKRLTTPPIFITEYNYAPDGGVCTDTMHTDPAFMSQWTTVALQTLARNGVAESYQFNTASCLPLEKADGALTAQGQAFANFWSA